MLGLYVTVPIACFRKGLAREYLETEALPPPATCYGFLLSLVGESDRNRHVGCRLTSVLLGQPEKSLVLRTIWRIKSNKLQMGQGNNRSLAQQELLTGVRLVLWVDSGDERLNEPNLEQRARETLQRPETCDRFGGLSFGESTHLVDEVKLFEGDAAQEGAIFLLQERGRLTLPVWVDHVGSAGTRYVTGDLLSLPVLPPEIHRLPKIEPPIPDNRPRRRKKRDG